MDRKISVSVSMPVWMLQRVQEKTGARRFSAAVQEAIAAWLEAQPEGGDRDREKICA
jgi:Arc/MetJ-type ribon-helix-helix transcriptional regulator